MLFKFPISLFWFFHFNIIPEKSTFVYIRLREFYKLGSLLDVVIMNARATASGSRGRLSARPSAVQRVANWTSVSVSRLLFPLVTGTWAAALSGRLSSVIYRSHSQDMWSVSGVVASPWLFFGPSHLAVRELALFFPCRELFSPLSHSDDRPTPSWLDAFLAVVFLRAWTVLRSSYPLINTFQ